MNKSLGVMLGVILVASIFSIALAEARTAPTKPTLSTNYAAAKPQVKSSGSAVQTPSSSGGKSCITQWGWNGKEWVLKDLVTAHGRVVSGQKCTPFNMYTKKVAPKPTEPFPGDDNSADPLPANWPNQKYWYTWNK